ncbi:MAG: phosphatase PAP2 family protein [Anaerolineales bacterium]|nr:phosphatase PAP2 family protein [Anaerolineales bacterium]
MTWLPAALTTIGLLIFSASLAHRLGPISRWDTYIFRVLHLPLSTPGLAKVFRVLWLPGTTPFSLGIIVLALILTRDLLTCGVMAVVYTAAVSVERVIKIHFKRERPFNALPNVRMGQPRRPNDPSYPSGDSLRIWFLTLALAFSFNIPLSLFLAALVLAALVSLGRIALGVHYPLDVLGGAGLGILFAGLHLLMLASTVVFFQ